MDRRFQKWEKIRAKGKLNYVLLYGAVLWGLSTAALLTLGLPLLIGAKITWSRALINVILFPLAGIGWGRFTWIVNEKAYRKSKGSEPATSPNGGPAESLGNSGESHGPPSVS